jgi:hypothetical protein
MGFDPLDTSQEEQAPKPKPKSKTKEDQGLNIDRQHHVPLLASAIMDEDGRMTGLAVDHRVDLSPEDASLVHLHEATELPMMNDLIKSGMSNSEAYEKAHAHAIERETAASKARWGDDGHEQYKERIRDAASIASQPSDRDRHPDAHTTRYGLDESELGKSWKVAGDVVEFPPAHIREPELHPPMQIDVLGAKTHFIGPGQPIKQFTDYGELGKAFPKSAKSMQKLDETAARLTEIRKWMKGPAKNIKGYTNENQIEDDLTAMERNYVERPEAYKYYRALFEQRATRSDEDAKLWEKWKKLENLSRNLGGPIGRAKEPKLKAVEDPESEPEK